MFTQLPEENGRDGGKGGVSPRLQEVQVGVGRLILFAFGTQTVHSMQIDTQWGLLCYFSSDIAVSLESQQNHSARASAHMSVCVCTVRTPARCVHLF